jgi:hypothetical protein
MFLEMRRAVAGECIEGFENVEKVFKESVRY